MKSARINFGQPHTEYKLEINEAGEAISCYNQDTDTEYIGGGGGGGVSNISKITVGFRTSVSGNYSEYQIDPYQGLDEPDYVGAFVITPDNGVKYNNLQAAPDYEYPIDMEIYLLSGRYILISADNISTAADYTITGNAEIVTFEELIYVKVTGDCTITTAGTPY